MNSKYYNKYDKNVAKSEGSIFFNPLTSILSKTWEILNLCELVSFCLNYSIVNSVQDIPFKILIASSSIF
jgi:hypothetical protein